MGDILQLDHLIDSVGTTLLAVEDLSRILRKSPASIRSDASRNPDALPPICRLPGNKRLLWRSQDVMNWVASFVQPSSIVTSDRSLESDLVTRRRGRPRKTEQRGVA